MKIIKQGTLIALILSGCTQEVSDVASEVTDSTEQPIISGTRVGSNSQFVAIYHKKSPDAYVSSWYWYPRPCSGTVIFQNNVQSVTLTAAHCVTHDLSHSDPSRVLDPGSLRLSTASSPGIVPFNADGSQTASPPATSVTPSLVVIHGSLDVALIFSNPLSFPGGSYRTVALGLHSPASSDVPYGTARDYGYGQVNSSDPDPENPKLESSAYGAGTLRYGTSAFRFAPSSTCAASIGSAAAAEQVDYPSTTGQPWHGDSGGPSFDYRQVNGANRSWTYQALLGVHSVSSLVNRYICNVLTNSYVTWMDGWMASMTGRSGFIVAPLVAPRNRALYVTSGSSGNLADLTLDTWPVGTRWTYDPSTRMMRDWQTRECLTGSGSGASGTNLYTAACNLSDAQKWTITGSMALKNVGNGKCLVNATVQSGSVRVTSSDQSTGPKKPYLANCDRAYDQMWYFSYNH
ncbi:MAG: RICIN domain-containing protein [Polyangiaceae bacterium]|nr:RICIN domain-containing protein [Polyangiaceae bacterium]